MGHLCRIFFCSIVHNRQKLKTNLILINRRMTRYILYTYIMKYDTDIKTNKLELYEILSFLWEKVCFAKQPKIYISYVYIHMIWVCIYIYIYTCLCIHMKLFLYIFLYTYITFIICTHIFIKLHQFEEKDRTLLL